MELSDDDKQRIRESLPKIHNLVVRNLVKAITEGKVPTESQLEMLRSAVAMPETPLPAAAPEFQLESVTVPKEIGAAAAWWGVDRKTIGQRWIPAGEKAGDPCPYREPALMEEWYKRVFRKPVPDAIREKLQSLQATAPAPAAPAAIATPGQLPALDMSQFNPADYNFDGMLMSMRTLLLAHQHLLAEAMKSGVQSRINKATEDLQSTAESLRKLEKDSGKILAEQGSTLRTADVRAAIIEAHQFIPHRFKTELKRMVRILPGLTMTDRELDEWAERTVDSACAALVRTDLQFAKSA